MELHLKKPIIFLDIETTGLNFIHDRIIEISLFKIYPNEKEKSKTMRVNPETPIPAKTTAIHGITDEDVKDKPLFKEVAKEIAQMIKGCDIAGYNSTRFDIPFLAEEFLRTDVVFDIKKCNLVDVQTIFHKMEPRTLVAAYKFYCNKELIAAHSAEADARATYEVLKAQLDRYDNLKNDIESLSKFSAHKKFADFAGFISYNKQGEEILNFGKHKGTTIKKIMEEQPGYFGWLLKSDFPRYTKKVLTEIKLRGLNEES